MTARCFVCGARMWEETERGLRFASGRRRAYRFACGSCGLLSDAPERGVDCRADLEGRLGGDAFASGEDAPYGLDLYTLRSAATLMERAVEPPDGEQAEALREPHGELAASARLVPLDAGDGPSVSLGVLCRADDLDVVLARLPSHRAWTGDIVVMVDGDAPPSRDAPGIRLVARPLDEDFAAQRNALQALAANPWMIQLDADESLDPRTGALLPALAGMADRDGVRSIGLPRRNLVDGVLSDLYPDVQYRLNRREARYAGRVHERPERPWQRSFMALHGAIDHYLARAHVLARSGRYEAMEPGGGRGHETAALLEPYRDRAAIAFS